MAQSVKDRVYEAAERISAERRPTVSTVRSAAGVSNADATRYLKEWAEEKHAAGGVLAATPATLLEAAARLAATAWAEASTLADERHAAVEAGWAQERKDKDTEIAELVTDLDRLTEDKDTAVAALTTRVTDLETQLNAAIGELEVSRTRELAAATDAAGAVTGLAAAAAREAALQGAYEGLLARISPSPAPAVVEPSGDGPDTDRDPGTAG